MKYIVEDYIISLEEHAVPLYSLTVEDPCYFSVFKTDFDMSIVATDVGQFNALMKGFFEGKYSMQIEKDYTLKFEQYNLHIEKNANGLELSFTIVSDKIVTKEFSLQLSRQLSEKEEHAAKINQLQKEHTAEIVQMQEDESARYMELEKRFNEEEMK